jgi:hypothetical protein
VLGLNPAFSSATNPSSFRVMTCSRLSALSIQCPEYT